MPNIVNLTQVVRPRGQRHHNRANCNAALIVVAATTIFLAMLALFFYFTPQESHFQSLFRGSSFPCRTVGCHYYDEIMTFTVNTSVDPCEDFEAYACSSWAPAAEAHSYGSASMGGAMGSWYERFPQELAAASRHRRVGKKLGDAFSSCMRLTSREDTKTGIIELKDFMRELRIPWPEGPLAGAEPLGVLLDLAFNWRVDAWFHAAIHRCSQVRTADARGKHLLLGAGTPFVPRFGTQREPYALSSYVMYWNSFYNPFTTGKPRRSKEYVDRIAKIEGSIFARLTQVVKEKANRPVQFQWRHIENFTANIPMSRWISQLSNNVKGCGELVLTDSVTVWDRSLLEAVNEMFANYTREELLEHIAWTFVQVYAPLADRRLLLAGHDDNRRAAEHRYIFCATQVELAYEWLFASVYASYHYGPDRQKVINELLTRVKQVAVDKISDVPWADDSKQTIAGHIRNVTVVLWPNSSSYTDDELSDVYDTFFEHKNHLFVQKWIWAMKKWHIFRKELNYTHIDEYPKSYVLPYFKYRHGLNTVLISLAAFSKPWYFTDGTKAMSYGSIGFSFASELAKAFDASGVPVDLKGDLTEAWPSSGWEAGSNAKASCLHPLSSTPFPEIPALEVAYSAFKSSVKDEGSGPRVSNTLSEEQVFFLSACFAMCQLPQTTNSYRLYCNKAVSNFVPFGRAFGCQLGTAMNPVKKCSFLD
ncbi:endothelin-converting enzyme 1-like [Haemaphysalis longicornis]|uniref:Uncharacterized protein n=1 Tax=Haemaphysalis longicornis TaxID=44386 RepID=A0A9J6FBU8_HAELO|nr:hypothetical protein HPB48_017130 [Haemaphysalis longicornis]